MEMLLVVVTVVKGKPMLSIVRISCSPALMGEVVMAEPVRVLPARENVCEPLPVIVTTLEAEVRSKLESKAIVRMSVVLRGVDRVRLSCMLVVAWTVFAAITVLVKVVGWMPDMVRVQVSTIPEPRVE